MSSNSGIYAIVNTVNGKQYIGSAKSLKSRKRNHINALKRSTHYNTHLQNAWDKYSEEAFTFAIIEYVSDVQMLIEREQHWLDLVRPYERQNGYNVYSTAGSPLGVKQTDETKRKISQQLKGNKYALGMRHSDEAKAKISSANKGNATAKGHTRSAEHRQKISLANIGNKHGAGNKHWVGRTHTEEAKEKIRSAMVGSVMSEETKAKVSLSLTGRILSDASKKKMSEARKKQSPPMLGKKHSEESINRMRVAQQSRRSRGQK